MSNQFNLSPNENDENPENSTAENKKKPFIFKRFFTNLAAILLVMVLSKEGLSGFIAPQGMIEYMNNTYHKEFVFNRWVTDRMVGGQGRAAEVSPVDEPSRKIRVDVLKGSNFWNFRYFDNYSQDLIEEYFVKRVQELAKSKYATKVMLKENRPSDYGYSTKTVFKLNKMYSVDQILKGPKAAPEAYWLPRLKVVYFGPKVDEEKMIVEMYELCKKVDGEFGHDAEGRDIEVAVIDEAYLDTNEEIKLGISQNNIERVLSEGVDLSREGQGWVFKTYLCKDGIPMSEIMGSYESFKSALKEFDKWMEN